MKPFFSFLLIVLGYNCQAQIPQFVIANSINQNDKKDTIFIHRISTDDLDSIVHSNEKLVIQLYQPWSRSSESWIDSLPALYKKLQARNIPFYLIVDTKREDQYCQEKDKDIGKAPYNIMMYNLQFPIYIIGPKEKTSSYQRRISEITGCKISDRNFCFYLKNSKVAHQCGSYEFNKTLSKIIQ